MYLWLVVGLGDDRLLSMCSTNQGGSTEFQQRRKHSSKQQSPQESGGPRFPNLASTKGDPSDW